MERFSIAPCDKLDVWADKPIAFRDDITGQVTYLAPVPRGELTPLAFPFRVTVSGQKEASGLVVWARESGTPTKVALVEYRDGQPHERVEEVEYVAGETIPPPSL